MQSKPLPHLWCLPAISGHHNLLVGSVTGPQIFLKFQSMVKVRCYILVDIKIFYLWRQNESATLLRNCTDVDACCFSQPASQGRYCYSDEHYLPTFFHVRTDFLLLSFDNYFVFLS